MLWRVQETQRDTDYAALIGPSHLEETRFMDLMHIRKIILALRRDVGATPERIELIAHELMDGWSVADGTEARSRLSQIVESMAPRHREVLTMSLGLSNSSGLKLEQRREALLGRKRKIATSESDLYRKESGATDELLEAIWESINGAKHETAAVPDDSVPAALDTADVDLARFYALDEASLRMALDVTTAITARSVHVSRKPIGGMVALHSLTLTATGDAANLDILCGVYPSSLLFQINETNIKLTMTGPGKESGSISLSTTWDSLGLPGIVSMTVDAKVFVQRSREIFVAGMSPLFGYADGSKTSGLVLSAGSQESGIRFDVKRRSS